MITNQRKVTSYTDFIKSIKSSKTSTGMCTSASTPKIIKDIKQNKSHVEESKPKHLRHYQEIKEIPTSRTKDIARETKILASSMNRNQLGMITRLNTDSDMIMTQRNSCQKSKSKSKSKSHFDSQSTIPKDSGTKRMSDANMIVYYMNEILLVLEEMPRLNPLKIAYLDYLELLRMLNMIQSSYEPSKTDHVHKFWSVISAKDSTLNIINFSLMFLASMNIHSNSKTIVQILQSSWNQQIPLLSFQKAKPMLIRVDKYGYLSLTKEEVRDIYDEFKEFRTTKMFLGRIQKKGNLIEQKLEQYTFHKFHPTISNKSVQLAKIRKERESHKTSLNEQMFEEQRSKYEEESRRQNATSREKLSLGQRRTELLYNLCKSKSKEKRDRSQDEIEFERHSKLYTFKPEIHSKINKKKAIPQKKNSTLSGEAKILERFLKGRIQKQVKKKNMEMGNTNNSKSTQKLRKKIAEQFSQKTLVSERTLIRQPSPTHITPPSKHAAKQPFQPYFQPQSLSQFHEIPQCSPQTTQSLKKQIFNFQVYLEGGVFVDVIRIYEGDCVQTIANEFTERHKLKPEMGQKLINSIKLNLESVKEFEGLEKIEEARESVQCSFDLGR